jgi:hypothetical protein
MCGQASCAAAACSCQANDPHEERALEGLKVDNNAIDRAAPAAKIVQGSENRYIETGMKIRRG